MIKSMTGYGRAEEIIDGLSISVEIKSVNHRYFEFSARVPRIYGFLEEKMKSFTNTLVSRGKIECYVNVENLEETETEISVNHSLAEGYLNALKELAEKFELEKDISAYSLSRFPDVISLHKAPDDEDRIWLAVQTVAKKAIDKFICMRQAEGEKLKNDVLTRADFIIEKVNSLRSVRLKQLSNITKNLSQELKNFWVTLPLMNSVFLMKRQSLPIK